ncbi:MAG: CcoQ/FixQ family Cbb3-type cytochrome c oxidase assembly chaperone [Cytophagaceae bacterium]
MLKYIKDHMASIGGIEIFPIISFCIFFTFFLAVVVWVYGRKKEHWNKMSNIPLTEKETEITG